MRKLVVSEFLSLDGVMEAPDKWNLPFGNDEREGSDQRLLSLLGAKTFSTGVVVLSYASRERKGDKPHAS